MNKKSNNILDIKELKTDKHRELVELVYYLPPSENMILYFYTLISKILNRNGYMSFMPHRIQNKTHKFLECTSNIVEKKQEEEKVLLQEETQQKKALSDISSKWIKLITECGDAGMLNDIYNLAVEFVKQNEKTEERNKLKEDAIEMLNRLEDEHSLFYVHGTIKAALVEQKSNMQGRF